MHFRSISFEQTIRYLYTLLWFCLAFWYILSYELAMSVFRCVGRAEFDCRQRQMSFLLFAASDRVWGPPSLLSDGHRGLFSTRCIGRDVKLTTRLRLLPRSRMVELYLSLPYDFMVLCLINRENITVYIYHYVYMKITVFCYVRSCSLVDILINSSEKSAASNKILACRGHEWWSYTWVSHTISWCCA
jgi:hypothetical protein